MDRATRFLGGEKDERQTFQKKKSPAISLDRSIVHSLVTRFVPFGSRTRNEARPAQMKQDAQTEQTHDP